MEIKEYWNNHGSLIETALNDYLRWFEQGEEDFDLINKAINDLNEVE